MGRSALLLFCFCFVVFVVAAAAVLWSGFVFCVFNANSYITCAGFKATM